MRMRSRGMALAALVSLLCAFGAVGCYLRSRQLKSDAAVLMERSNAEAAEYARSFDGRYEDKQLATYEERRDSLERAHTWQVAQMLLILAGVASAFASYVFFLFRRLREQLVDALPEETLEFEPVPVLARGAK
jgi:hypothetical protein